MIVNVLVLSGAVAIGYSLRCVHQDISDLLEQGRQRQAEMEITRMTSGWAQEPEVDVESEDIKPSWRERLADWWAQTWATSQPREGLQIAGSGFTSMTSRVLRDGPRRQPQEQYEGVHRADKTLMQEQDL